MSTRKPQRTRAKVPRHPKPWIREAQGDLAFLERLTPAVRRRNQSWHDKMLQHYTDRVADLLDRVPASLKDDPVVETMRQRLKACRQRSTS